ncbi:MAG TPA: formylglycine-generating enzyme family protein [Spirochaetota bacterium]|nr:formylglycine-generating enzyme family protein [Spirochaetota bacterium]
MKCRLEGKYSKYLSSVQLGMPVYKYVRGVEKERKDPVRRYQAGDTKTVGGIELVYIPGGSFMMGSPDGEGGSDEHPRHKVTVSPFWMGKYEVTQALYQTVMGRNPSWFCKTGAGSNRVQKDTSRYPVEQVSWYDAVEFCNTLSRHAGRRPAYIIDKTRQDSNNTSSYDRFRWTVRVVSGSNGFRLPYEAEWEYACRAETTMRYYWGESVDGNCCWYGNKSGTMTHPVGGKRPNAFGLYDMSGNVEEWCMDWYDENYYRISPEVNPQGPASGGGRVLRSGSWNSFDSNIRSAHRDYGIPINKYSFLGFRVILSGGAE